MKKLLFVFAYLLCVIIGTQAQPSFPHFAMVTQSKCLNIIRGECSSDSIEIFKVQSTVPIIITFDYFVDLEPGKGWEHNCVYYSFQPTYPIGSSPTYTKTYATRPNGGETLIPLSTLSTSNTVNMEVPIISLNTGQLNSDGQLYAVILSGGGNADSNYVRYWNDCSYIYKTLRNRFGVPSDNISLLISDGADPGLDMKLGNGTYISSPLDLDNDSINETIFAATKNNLISVLDSLASVMSADDRLFFYVIDHGGRSDNHSYICLWNYEKIYDYELASLFDDFSISSMNIVLGQCYSGGFVSYLSAPNRVVSTACAANEKSYAMADLLYDEFVHHWTTAVNEHDVYGDRVISDTNNNGFVSASEAFIYAFANDVRNETPQYSSTPNIFGDSLALNEVPFTYDLYVRDNEDDTGIEPNTTTTEYWASPDIWMRNQQDGLYGHESIQVYSSDQDLYTYVRVTNRGEKDYNGRGMYLHLYWAAASTGLTINNWSGNANDYYVSGCPLPAKLVKDTIRVGETKTVLVRWPIPEEIADSVLTSGEPFHICHLAWLTPNNSFSAPIPYDPDCPTLAGVLPYKTIAQVNASFVATNSGSTNMPLIVRNVTDEECEYSIEVIPCEKNPSDIKKMEIGMRMEEPLYRIWKDGGEMVENATIYKKAPNEMLVRQYGAKISNLLLPKADRQRLRVNCTCSIVADEDITEETKFEYDIVQRDLKTGQIVGGEHFTVVQQPRKAIRPEIVSSLTKEGYELRATNVNEDANYVWLDEQGCVVAEGPVAKIVPSVGDKQIRLKVTAKCDGAVNYASFPFDMNFGIECVTPSPFCSYFTVSLSSPAAEGTVLRIAPVNVASKAEVYKMNSGERDLTVNTVGYKPGIYLVALIVDGTVVDTRSVVCQ